MTDPICKVDIIYTVIKELKLNPNRVQASLRKVSIKYEHPMFAFFDNWYVHEFEKKRYSCVNKARTQ